MIDYGSINFINNNYWTKGLVDRILQLNSIMTCSCNYIGHNTDIMIDISSKRFACKIC